MVTYHGVPLLDNQGELFGTMCHFDVVSYYLPDAELELLRLAARKLPRYLPCERHPPSQTGSNPGAQHALSSGGKQCG